MLEGPSSRLSKSGRVVVWPEHSLNQSWPCPTVGPVPGRPVPAHCRADAALAAEEWLGVGMLGPSSSPSKMTRAPQAGELRVNRGLDTGAQEDGTWCSGAPSSVRGRWDPGNQGRKAG